MAKPVTVKISKSLRIGEADVTELTFHEATIGDMIAADGVEGDFAKTAAILASMAGVDFASFKSLPARDLNKITQATAGLLGNGDTPEDSGSV